MSVEAITQPLEYPEAPIPFIDHEVQETVKLHGYVRVEGGKEAVPWTAEFPEQIAYNGLTLLIPGYGGIKRSSRDERHANALMGRPTISYDPARISGNVIENLTNSQGLHTRTAEAVISAVQDKVTHDRSIPSRRQLDAERVVASVHSMGGFAGTEIGLAHSGQVESVIYKGAAGFWPLSLLDMNPLRLAQSVNKYVASGQIEPNVRNLYRIIRYYTRDPSRSIGEAMTCLTSDISDRIAQLEDLGVSSGYLAFEHDELVPSHKAQEKTKGVVGHFAMMHGMGHLAPQSHPKETAQATWELQQIIQADQKPALWVV